MHISELLKARLLLSDSKTDAELGAELIKDFNKRYAKGVEAFRTKLNEDRKGTKYKPLSFIAVKSKLAGIKHLDDLRWFYMACIKYSLKETQKIHGITSESQRHTFSECFFGALRIK